MKVKRELRLTGFLRLIVPILLRRPARHCEMAHAAQGFWLRHRALVQMVSRARLATSRIGQSWTQGRRAPEIRLAQLCGSPGFEVRGQPQQFGSDRLFGNAFGQRAKLAGLIQEKLAV